MVKYYRKAMEMRWEDQNYMLWLQGVYVYDAICAVAPVLHAFSKKGAKPIPYHEKPLPITEAQAKAREEEAEKNQFENNKTKFLGIVAQINASMAKKAQKGEPRNE